MTPEQKLKHLILIRAAEFQGIDAPEVTQENVDEWYNQAFESDDGSLQDAANEIRSSGTKTGLKCDYSRHYESDAVAVQYLDRSWVGFTYWYGGGKHGEPEAMDWIEYAYDVDCQEEEKVVTVQTFTKTAA